MVHSAMWKRQASCCLASITVFPVFATHYHDPLLDIITMVHC